MRKLLLFWVPIVAILAATSFAYFRVVSSFSFVDEYNNFIVAWFMLQGRQLYSEVFFNHQVLTEYLSYVLIAITKPQTLYSLVMIHRVFMIVWSFGWAVYLVKRFRIPALLTVILFELSKYYLFGHLFQAEGMIVYPLITMFGYIWEKFEGKVFKLRSYVFMAVLCWFVAFMREPFIPLTGFLFVLFLFERKLTKNQIYASIVFAALSLLTIAPLPLREYIFSLVEVNKSDVIRSELQAQGNVFVSLMRSFLYPILAFVEGKASHMLSIHKILGATLALTLFLHLHQKKRSINIVILVLGSLTLAAIRIVQPGAIFYEAYRMLPWYALLFASCSWLGWHAWITKSKRSRWVKPTLTAALFGIVYLSLRPGAFFWEHVDRNTLFTNNYARFASIGSTVNLLSNADDTFFVNDYSSLTYWPAQRATPYKYALYYPVTVRIPMYEEERLSMFHTSPPDFYDAGDCDPEKNTGLPVDIRPLYHGLKKHGEQSCLFVLNNKLTEISKEQWKAAEQYGYTED